MAKALRLVISIVIYLAFLQLGTMHPNKLHKPFSLEKTPFGGIVEIAQPVRGAAIALDLLEKAHAQNV